MSKDHNDTTLFTRGGQIFLHNLRMLFQVFDKVFLFTMALFIGATLIVSWNMTTSYERYILSKYAESKAMSFVFSKGVIEFIQPNQRKVKVNYQDFIENAWVKAQIKILAQKILIAVIAGLFCAVVVFTGVWQYLRRKGQKHTQDELLKGDKILTASQTKKMIINNRQNSDLHLATLPLIKMSETAHLFFHGTTGSGKSNAIKELLDQIRHRGDRAIIFDKSCNYLEEFFLPRTDILLNPLDIRTKIWGLWEECRDSADFDSLASALIPMPLSTQDPFWIHAARTIFSAAAYEMRNDKDRSIAKLLRVLLTADMEVIQHYLKDTEAATLVSDKIEKTAVSIKSVLATYLKSLKYVNEDGEHFSIREWIQNDNGKNWLFVTSLGDRHETLKPLITCWLDIAVNSLLSLEANENRRIWLILDELTSLHQLPYLTQVLSEARKFGGCIVIGIQNYAQLAKLYGRDGAQEISSLLNSRFMYRQPDPEMAAWAAKNFGEAITNEFRENISYGANTMRDGISINHAETRKPVVSFSEIMSLPNLDAFVRLPGNYPIVRVSFEFKPRKKMNKGFLLRPLDENKIKEIDGIFDNVTTSRASEEGGEKVMKRQAKKSVNKEKEKTVKSKAKSEKALFEE